MSRPADTVEKLGETLTMCSYESGGNKGFWLYDETRGMNLSIRAKTRQDAFVECISYYQNRLAKVEKEHRELVAKVESFVSQFTETEDD